LKRNKFASDNPCELQLGNLPEKEINSLKFYLMKRCFSGYKCVCMLKETLIGQISK